MQSLTDLEGHVDAEYLLARAPLTLGQVLEIGPGTPDLKEAYGRLCPGAQYRIESDPPSGGEFDLILVRSFFESVAAAAAALESLSRNLAPNGSILFPVLRRRGGVPVPSLRLLATWIFDPPDGPAGGLVLCSAVRAAEPARPRLIVHFRYMAMRFMDIRTELPTAYLSRDAHLRVSSQDGATPFNPSLFQDDQPKILVTQRPRALPESEWLHATSKLIKRGWISVVETDDHLKFSCAIRGEVPSSQDWRDFSLYHGIQTSTAPLAAVLAPYNPNIAIFPNAVFDLPPLPSRGRPVRVFYGALYRGPYAVDVARSLTQTAALFPDVEFIVVGDDAVFEALPTNNKRRFGTLSYAAYLRAMSQCDICLSPLDYTEEIETKSDAKFLDASRSGLVTIASPTVYARTIVHSENGLIAYTLADWDKLLIEVLGNPLERARIGRAAWNYVRQERMFVHQVDARRAWYQSLWDNRAELNAQLIERAPGLLEYL
jgi:glycosyltransferase involved in cell wall biosynthesis